MLEIEALFLEQLLLDTNNLVSPGPFGTQDIFIGIIVKVHVR